MGFLLISRFRVLLPLVHPYANLSLLPSLLLLLFIDSLLLYLLLISSSSPYLSSYLVTSQLFLSFIFTLSRACIFSSFLVFIFFSSFTSVFLHHFHFSLRFRFLFSRFLFCFFSFTYRPFKSFSSLPFIIFLRLLSALAFF